MADNRYIRQTLLDKIGEAGQQKLRSAHVVIVGCGGLGSIAAPYLAGAGIGKLTLVDGDMPDICNLHRQVFFSTLTSHTTKSMALAQHIQKLNPDVDLAVVSSMISKGNIENVITKNTIVLECTDDIMTKYLVNDFCNINGVPMIYGAIHKYEGYVSLFDNKNKESIHLRDIFAEPNEDIPTCSEVGVMGTLAGLIGLMQANEAIKYITQAGSLLAGHMLTYDIMANEQMKLKLKKVYAEDINSTYAKSDYKPSQKCLANEINIEDVRNNRAQYRLVSILQDDEHRPIDGEVERELLHKIDKTSWQPKDKKITVFYCMSGKRSMDLINGLLQIDPSRKILSLKGGLKEVLK